MPGFESRFTAVRRSRRNLVAAMTLATSAVFLKGRSATAQAHEHGEHDRDDRAYIACFLRGTSIRTAGGEKLVEDLLVGDVVPTVFGKTRPIQWIGRYRFGKSDRTQAWAKELAPVRIARSALGPNMPHSDLYVTRTHALLIDDVLVPVCNLLNGTTITVFDARLSDELEFFHIKLEHHDVIYAEGAPCETLLSVDEKALNSAEYFKKYGPNTSNNTPCVPVLGFGVRVEISSRLRSAASLWIDRRKPLDVIRDKLEEGEPLLLRELGLAPP